MKIVLLALALLFQFPSVPVAPGPRGSIEGVVTTVDGVPIAGAEVTAFWWPSPFAYSPGDLPRTTSDNAGHFVLRDIGAGGYRVRATAPGYVWQEFGAADAGNQSSSTGTVLNLGPGETKEGMLSRFYRFWECRSCRSKQRR
jgi:hypothetical protein